MKLNKTKINSRDRLEFKEMYFNKIDIKERCKELGYNFLAIKKWLN